MLLGRKTDRAAEQTYADNGEFSKHRRGLNRKGASIESLEAEFAVTDNNEFLERPTKRPRVGSKTVNQNGCSCSLAFLCQSLERVAIRKLAG